MRASKRNSIIDFMKFIYAVVVVIFHGRKLAYNGEFTYFQSGYLSVEFFFIVSGYLMMSAASRVYSKENLKIGEETAKFLLHKIKGLYPSILFAYVFTLAAMIFTAKEPLSIYQIGSSIWELLLLRMSGIDGLAVNTITWYISAMLICMLFLYPLLLKFKENFAYIGAPLLAIFCLGYLSQTGFLTSPEKWMGFSYRGIFRATAELCIGCISYLCVQHLKKRTFTTMHATLLSLLMWGCFLVSLHICNIPGSDMGYVFVLLVAVAITLAFSGITGTSASKQHTKIYIFKDQVCSWLGKFSLPLYLNHYYLRIIFRYFKFSFGYKTQIILYLLASVMMALIAMYAVAAIEKLFKKHVAQ